MGRSYVNKQIAASQVLLNLGTIVPTIPATESQARPLARLVPEQQAKAWEEAVKTAPDGRITARHINKIVNQILEIEIAGGSWQV